MMKRMLSSAALAYFRILAQIQLKKISPTIIGITGSAGKTSTLQAAEATLSDHFQLKVSHKANSESGIPLNILGLHLHNYSSMEWLRLAILAPLQLLFNWSRYDIYLVEMGIDGPDEPKNMSYLLKILQPDVGIFLNAAPTHAEPFDHLVTATNVSERREQLTQLIAAEKGKIITSLPKSGTAILNADDTNVKAFEKKTQADVITFGTHKDSDLTITKFTSNLDGTNCEIKYIDESKEISFIEYILPNFYGASFAAGIAAGMSQKLTFEQAVHSFQHNFKLPPGRSSLIRGINNSLILDSTYNSSTAPTLDMLELLSKTNAKRKLALLGDMRELGEMTQHEHETVATSATKICDAIYLVGPYMKQYALPLIEKTKTPVKWFANAYEAADYLKNELQKDDLILVKASQNTLLLEIAVEKLMENPEDADKLLCRRGEYWNKQRQAIREQ